MWNRGRFASQRRTLAFFVRGLVGGNDGKFRAGRRGLVQQGQELQPLLVAVAFLAQTDHFAGGGVQGAYSVTVPLRL